MIAAADFLAAARAVAREVLEAMFFSEAEPVSCQHLEECVAVRVGFHGGEMAVMISPQLAVAASAAFLAEDSDEVTTEQREMVSRELANILCGAVLSRLHPDQRVALRAPEMAAPDFGSGAAVHQCFATPEGRLAITARLDCA
ncbi:MAG TPA: chemotaxis protein CheX [Bryobacteraceae bacterium]|nr:chemotaxis protein CheX [Bryobacteraceae bacterium]